MAWVKRRKQEAMRTEDIAEERLDAANAAYAPNALNATYVTSCALKATATLC